MATKIDGYTRLDLEDNNKLRVECNFNRPDVYADECKDTHVQLDVLVSTDDWSAIPVLLPNVTHLRLRIFDEDQRYDVRPLLKLAALQELEIGRAESDVCRLLHLGSLGSLKLRRLSLFGKTLDPAAPTFVWPKIRDPRWAHLGDIETMGALVTYRIGDLRRNKKARKMMDELVDADCRVGDVWIQKLGGKAQLLYFDQEGNNGNIRFVSLTRAQWTLLLGGSSAELPKSEADLWIEDRDDDQDEDHSASRKRKQREDDSADEEDEDDEKRQKRARHH